MVISVAATMAIALLLPSAPKLPSPAASSTRRAAMQQGAAAVAVFVTSVAPLPALADEPAFSKMGGLLEPYIDTGKGYKVYKPAGWNQFDTDPGVYDVKFQDIIESDTTVQVSSSPVATATSVNALGELNEVGKKFAASRNGELISASSREADGSLCYTFEIKGEKYHELLLLSINRGKLFRLVAVTSNKKWDKREKLYRNIVASFVPKGF